MAQPARDNFSHRFGNIYHYERCTPLDGGAPKPHYVILLDSPEAIRAGGQVLVMVCTSKAIENSKLDADRVRLPSLDQTRTTTTGFHKPTWAIPRWTRWPVLSDLAPLPGRYLSGATLRKVRDAVWKRLREQAGHSP